MQVIVEQAGVDEAGCGALMGDLVASAVILPSHFDTGCLADSKKLTPARRERAFAVIQREARVGIGRVSVEELNQHPFAWARRTVFQRALDALGEPLPTSIVVDGNGFFDGYRSVSYECLPKADATFAAVAAASIVAKVTRDRLVDEIVSHEANLASRYQWSSNKGYPAPAHLEGLKTHGVTHHHRLQFGPCARVV